MAIGAIWGNIWNESNWNPAIWAQSETADVTPDAFDLGNQNNVESGVDIYSNVVTVSGVDAGEDIPVTISGTNARYQVSTDSGSSWGAELTASSNVQLGYMLRVVVTTGAPSSIGNATLTVGGVSDTLNYSVAAVPTAPYITGQIPPLTFTVGATISLDLSGYFADPNDDELTFTSAQLPAGGLDVSSAGVLSGTATLLSNTFITLVASDGSESAQNTFGLKVIELSLSEISTSFTQGFSNINTQSFAAKSI